ncbi:Methionyl-tRNA formyltransferase [Bienertia sinuspersici]
MLDLGSKLLLHELPSILDGTRINAQPQHDSKATLAPKITPEESWLSFDQVGQELELEFRLVSSSSCALNAEPDYVAFRNGALIFTCGGGTKLEVNKQWVI